MRGRVRRGWETAHPGGLFRGWDSVLEGLRGGDPAHGPGEHQMMCRVGARGEHGGDMAVHVGVFGCYPSKLLPPEPYASPHRPRVPQGQSRELWVQPKTRGRFLTYFWGTHRGRHLSPPHCPQGKRDQLDPAPLSGQLQGGSSLSRPSCCPVPQEQTLPAISRSCRFPPDLDVERDL